MTNVTYFLGIRVRDLLLVNPILRLGVLRIVNLLGWVEGRLEVLEERTSLLRLAIDQHVVGIVGTTNYRKRRSAIARARRYSLENEGIEVSQLLNGRMRSKLEMLLLNNASLGALVANNEVHLCHTVMVRKGLEYEHMRRTLVPGQVRSGPNMTTQGVVSENSLPLVWKPSSSNLR